MNNEIYNLKPERLWYYFGEILQIPRPSKREEKIAAYLVDFGRKHGLETIKDETGNILIRKPATPGMENRKTVVLQSHIDMVCEKNSDVTHDFDNDPIQAYVDNGWVKARGTTLGGDNGIGVATELAILEAGDIVHGPLECLFTVDEETGLTGAFGIKPGFLKGEILLNLDSEDDGELFIGCAGGKDTVIELPFKKEKVPTGYQTFVIKVSGLTGGHSGDDIHKNRGNANKVLTRLLSKASEDLGLRLSTFDGGNLRNAIAREAMSVSVVPAGNASKFEILVSEMEKISKAELYVTEPELKITCQKTDPPAFIIDPDTQAKLLNSLYACPHGVIAWSQDIPNFVETSTNLASVKMTDTHFKIATSQRSSIESAKDNICSMVAAVFKLAGGSITHSDGYPGWTPNPHAEIIGITVDAFKKLFNQEPVVRAIHAGLECGLIGDKYPGMEMISFGPTMRNVHSPDEKLEINAVGRFWLLTLEVLQNIPVKKHDA